MLNNIYLSMYSYITNQMISKKYMIAILPKHAHNISGISQMNA